MSVSWETILAVSNKTNIVGLKADPYTRSITIDFSNPNLGATGSPLLVSTIVIEYTC